MSRVYLFVSFSVMAMFAPNIWAEDGAAAIDAKALQSAQDRPDLWAHYSRDYKGWRHAPMDQINRETVKRLAPRWIFQTGVLAGHSKRRGSSTGSGCTSRRRTAT